MDRRDIVRLLALSAFEATNQPNVSMSTATQPTDYTITPNEIKALEEYIEALKEPTYYREELQNRDINSHLLNIARRLIDFQHKQKEVYKQPIVSQGNNIYVKYLVDTAQQNYELKVLLHDSADLLLYMAGLYSKSLETSSRHFVLSKTVADMTGYEVQRLVSYLLDDIQARQQAPTTSPAQ